MRISTPSFRLRPARPFPSPLSLPHAAVLLHPLPSPLRVSFFCSPRSVVLPMFCYAALSFSFVDLLYILNVPCPASSYSYCLLLPPARRSRSLKSFPTSAHRAPYILLTYAYYTLARTALLLYLGSCHTDLSSSSVPLPLPSPSLSLSRTRRHICIQVRPPVHFSTHATDWQSTVLEQPSRHTTGPTFEQAPHLENRYVCIPSYTTSRLAHIPY